MVHLHPADTFLEGIDKEEVVDGGFVLGDDARASFVDMFLHREEGTEGLFLKGLLDGEFLAVLDIHGVPVVLNGWGVVREFFLVSGGSKGTSARISDTSTRHRANIVFRHAI